jgi:hypothetical protein
MKQPTATDWFQMVASIAVIVGLILVIVELRQTKVLVRAELASEYSTAWDQRRFTLMGEDAALVVAKVCSNPGTLTMRDVVIYEAMLDDLWARIWRLQHIEAFADLGIPWEAEAAQNIRKSLHSAHGRWYAAHIAPTKWGPVLADIAARFVEANDYDDCGAGLSSFLELENPDDGIDKLTPAG